MGIDISRKQGKTYLQEDQTWIKGGILHAPADGILLDRTAFDFDATFTDNLLPSGIVLGKITATEMYGPYTPAAADGTETAAGFLLTSVAVDPDSNGDVGASLAVRVDVIENYLPDNHGLDAAARTDLANFVRFHTYNHLA